MKNCSSCGAEIYDQAVICVKCGATQVPAKEERKCPYCKSTVDENAIICVKCGQSLQPQNAVSTRKAGTPAKASAAAWMKWAFVVFAGFASIVGIITGIVGASNPYWCTKDYSYSWWGYIRSWTYEYNYDGDILGGILIGSCVLLLILSFVSNLTSIRIDRSHNPPKIVKKEKESPVRLIASIVSFPASIYAIAVGYIGYCNDYWCTWGDYYHERSASANGEFWGIFLIIVFGLLLIINIATMIVSAKEKKKGKKA